VDAHIRGKIERARLAAQLEAVHQLKPGPRYQHEECPQRDSPQVGGGSAR
jgi:hypothetical protein